MDRRRGNNKKSPQVRKSAVPPLKWHYDNDVSKTAKSVQLLPWRRTEITSGDPSSDGDFATPASRLAGLSLSRLNPTKAVEPVQVVQTSSEIFLSR